MTTDNLIEQFREKASLVSAFLHNVETLENAFETAINLCVKKPASEDLMAGTASSMKETDTEKIIAAPNLTEGDFGDFQSACRKKGLKLINTGMRQHPGGIDMGFTVMDFGIADTGTLVLNSNSEETRLATMLSEIHVAVLKKSTIRPTALSMAEELRELQSIPGSYTAFITGASRTADIERVLALGVHGPLELHIMLLEE